MKSKLLSAALLTGLVCGEAQAAIEYFSTIELQVGGQYYTEMAGIAGGLGNAVVMSGGGNGANVGQADGRNDDGFSNISLNFTTPFTFYGTAYTSLFANNNGNISFGGGIATYTPLNALPLGTNRPVIAPFFADVDTRSAGGVMYLNQSVANQTILTWDQVDYFDATDPFHTSLLNSFQVVIRGADYAVPTTEGRIGFFWKTMEWETGDKSGGAGGYSTIAGTAAAVGFGNGTTDGQVLLGSMDDGISYFVQDHYIWFNLNAQGAPVLGPVLPPPPAVPEPGSYAMLLAGLGLLGLTARRRRQDA